MNRHLRILTFAVIFLAVSVDAAVAENLNFQRDIRPILSEYCFRCHGFDEHARKSGLRLDQFEAATRPAESGSAAIVPSQPGQSELIRRVTSDDPELRMPPAEGGKKLSAGQIETLRKWIEQGAGYTRHWAFEPPAARPLPHVKREDWPRNRIDVFVLNRLEQAALGPREAAEPARLLRRVAFDLTGLPPTPEQLDQFLLASSINADAAYAAEVDRLLNSPHFGERLAIDWLDLARYADTNGYFGDKARQAWPWRDWVIRAFNDNMPFDQFTIEQLAGDLLPNATREQRIATGFHRNSMANNETGIIDEEYRVEAVADRVETTSAVWLGMTIGCAQCHDHKYDPITQQEYYQFFAYFNHSVESGLVTKDSPPPTLEVPSAELEASLRHVQQELKEAEHTVQSQAAAVDQDLAAWQTTAAAQFVTVPEDALFVCDFDGTPAEEFITGTALQRERGIRGQAGKFDATQHVERPLPSQFDADQPWTISVWAKPSSSLSCIWSKIEPHAPRRGMEMIWQKGRLQVNLVHRWGIDEIAVSTRDTVALNDWHHVLVSYAGTRRADGLQIVIDGTEVPLNVHRNLLSGSIQCAEPLRIGRRDSGLGFYGLLDEFRILQRIASPAEQKGWSDSERIRGILARSKSESTAAEQHVLRDYYILKQARPEVRHAYERLQQTRRRQAALNMAVPTALVMQDQAQPRKTHLLVRGQYDKLGPEVQPGIPAIFPRLPPDAPPNRLALARWLVSPRHPLTARVAVNRLWQMCFGEGLVRTPNDFGSQGEMPSHPELLDDLALRFVDSGWDVKQILRLIVMSATYRQSSQATAQLLEHDPENRLLARGPRFRLPAELIRDQALAVSGLLTFRVGGPSVKPYQPEGLWEAVSYNGDDSYVVDQDDGLWRRSLYTYWKRQAPPPALLTFDANTREKCLLRRSRTNTPMQALVVLNDTTYVEAARQLATRALLEPGNDESRLKSMYRRTVSRAPEPAVLKAITELLNRQRQAFAQDPASADQLIKVGAAPAVTSLESRELAAWTLVAQTILNLDEVLTRR